MSDLTFRLRDGRQLGYAEYGDPAGKPVIFFQGTPSSRLLHPDEAITTELGARLIVIDRPGFGLSDFKPHRTLLDWPDDVIELMDAIKIDRFAAVGISGGGPYVAACAYKIPQRLTAAMMVSSGGRPMRRARWTASRVNVGWGTGRRHMRRGCCMQSCG